MVLAGEAVDLLRGQRLGIGDGSRHRHVEPLVAELALERGGVQRLEVSAVVLHLLRLVGRQADVLADLRGDLGRRMARRHAVRHDVADNLLLL